MSRSFFVIDMLGECCGDWNLALRAEKFCKAS
jgi:hypothetical protein